MVIRNHRPGSASPAPHANIIPYPNAASRTTAVAKKSAHERCVGKTAADWSRVKSKAARSRDTERAKQL